MAVGPGAGNNNACNNNDPEEMKQDVDLKVQIIFSSLSYSKFCQEQGAKPVSSDKPGKDTKIVLYAAQTWPAETYSYNEDADEVIFIDCGSDRMSQYRKSDINEKKLTKYMSFAIMRLKDILYRMTVDEKKHGKVHCQLISMHPCQKCMFAMSALLGKIIGDGAIYNSFIFDVLSQPEYRYTFNWIRNYGWSIDVIYNCAFSPYQARVEANVSPAQRMKELDGLLGGAETRYSTFAGAGIGELLASNPALDVIALGGKMAVGAIGGIFSGEGAGEGAVQAYDDFNNTTFDIVKPSKQIWADPDKKWVKQYGGGYKPFITDPKDPGRWIEVDNEGKVVENGETKQKTKWVDENGNYQIRYKGQVKTYEEWHEEWRSLAHPNDEELKQRVEDAKADEINAQIRLDRTNGIINGARERSADEITESYINNEIASLRSNPQYASLSDSEARQMLAREGFIPRDAGGNNLMLIDGKYVDEYGAKKILAEAENNLNEKKKTREEAEKALELKERSDKLFWLNALQTLLIVPCAVCAPFAIADIVVSVAVFHQQGKMREMNGGNYGGDTSDKVLLGVTIVLDVVSLVPLFMKPPGGAVSGGAVKPKLTPKATATPKVPEAPKVKISGKTRKATNAQGETEWHTTVTHEDGHVEVIKRDKDFNVIERDNNGNVTKYKNGDKVTWESEMSDGAKITETISDTGEVKQYKNGQLFSVENPNGERKTFRRNDKGEITGIHYSTDFGDGNYITTKFEAYENGVNTYSTVNIGEGNDIKMASIKAEGGRIDNNGIRIDGNSSPDSPHSTPSKQKTKEPAASEEAMGGSEDVGGGGNDTEINNLEHQNQDLAEMGEDATMASSSGNADETVNTLKKRFMERGKIIKDNFADAFKNPSLAGLTNDYDATFVKKAINVVPAAWFYYNAFLILMGDTYSEAGQDYQDQMDVLNDSGTVFTGTAKQKNELSQALDDGYDASELANITGDLIENRNNTDFDNGVYGLNEAANNAVSAQQNLEAVNTYINTEKEINEIIEANGWDFDDDHFVDLINQNSNAKEIIKNNEIRNASSEYLTTEIEMDKIPVNDANFDNRYNDLLSRNTDAWNTMNGNIDYDKYMENAGLSRDVASAQAQGAEADLEIEKFLYNYQKNKE